MEIKGNTILLREWQLSDLEKYKTYNKAGFKWQDYDGPYYGLFTPEELENMLLIIEKNIKQDSFPEKRYNLIISSKNSNIIIGKVSCYWKSKETNWLEIGISIYDDKYWGKGIGEEAFSLWTTYLLKNMPELVRIGFSTWSGNLGMIKLGEKLGFKLEARIRKARIVKGEYFDSLSYGVLREEWFLNS